MMDHPDYQALAAVLQAAYDQASAGKGAERHARGNPFHEQHMQTISNLLDSDRGMAFQAIKKLTEGLDFTDPDRRERELLGVIVYVAGIIVWHRARERSAASLDNCGTCSVCCKFLVGEEVDNHECRRPAPIPRCPDCGAPEGDLHYVLCPRLQVPEEHAKAVEEAFAAEQFDEARADIIGQNGNDGLHYAVPAGVDIYEWSTWQVGDKLECIRSWSEDPDIATQIGVGEVVTLTAREKSTHAGDVPFAVRGANYDGWIDIQDYDVKSHHATDRFFRFHSRPYKIRPAKNDE